MMPGYPLWMLGSPSGVNPILDPNPNKEEENMQAKNMNPNDRHSLKNDRAYNAMLEIADAIDNSGLCLEDDLDAFENVFTTVDDVAAHVAEVLNHLALVEQYMVDLAASIKDELEHMPESMLERIEYEMAFVARPKPKMMVFEASESCPCPLCQGEYDTVDELRQAVENGIFSEEE